jgi:GT2 family glycosyltransferase
MLAYMSPCSTLVRADIVRRLGGFYSRDQCLYGEDAFLWLKVLLNETVALTLRPLARIHREASSLSTNRHGVRPVEPFLTHPDEIEEYCPADLRDLLARVLAIRAFKTACVLGYWGHWREARALINRFAVPGDWRLPRYFAAQLCGTRFGAGLGTAWRTVLARRIQFSVNDEALGL